ncbi:MAG TPA: MFS transporter [Alphaproteobacteria bacterium]|jgi:MFS family permease|nr:MFS transporter [Alphaproteobacteria bacterium]
MHAVAEHAACARLNAARLEPAKRGLDWLNLWVATIQTGFGPFVAVYLTSRGWTQTAIGLALSLGTLTAMASQIPAGALVDATPHKSRVAVFSIVAFAVCALLFALYPTPLSIYVAEVLHGFSSCTLGPAIAAISLALVGQVALGERLGRNARFASIGNGVGAALMGGCGYYLSERAVFFMAAATVLPALLALRPLVKTELPEIEVDADDRGDRAGWRKLGVLADHRLLALAACATLFTLSDSAMLPLAGSSLTKQVGSRATLLIAACIVLPQILVALLSPYIGRLAGTHGRRPVLLTGFAALTVRGALFAFSQDPAFVIAVQLLNGVASAVFLIMVPLIVSDIAGRSGHFNLALGAVGLAIGVGGTFSTTLGGWITDRWGDSAGFLSLAAVGLAATLLVFFTMPETRVGALRRTRSRKEH